MAEHLSLTHPSPLDVHTVLSAALLRQGIYRAAGHRTKLTGQTVEGSVIEYALHDHYAWESTNYPIWPPVPSPNAHRQLLEQGSSILALTGRNKAEETAPSYTICQPAFVHPEYAIGGLFYEVDAIPPLVTPPTGLSQNPSHTAIVASHEQAGLHYYVTDASQESPLMAAYTAALQQHSFSAREQSTPGTLDLEEQYASGYNLGSEPSVRTVHNRGQATVLRAMQKSAYQIDFGLPEHVEHLTVLSKLGISVPSFRYQIGKRAIFTEVDYIEPAFPDREEALLQPRALQAAAKLPGLISLYQNWSLQQETGWTLSDIHNLHQYTYGVNCAAPGAQQPKWWLTDIEPLSDNRRANLERYSSSFYTEVSNAQSRQQQLAKQQPYLF